MDLDEFEIVTDTVEKSEHFVVDNDEKASWALRKLATLRKKMAEQDAIAQKEIERVQQWLETAKKSLENDAEFFESLLLMYAQKQRVDEGRATISLPYGKIKSRATRAKVQVVNEEEFLAWAKESQPELIRVKETANISELSKLVKDSLVVSDTGEIIPAVTVIPDGISYTIETEE